MKICITGSSKAGKSTLFAAFLGTGQVSESSKQQSGVISIPDSRVDELSELYKPKKITYATVTFEDCYALDSPVKQDRIKLYDTIKVSDALLMVIGAYRCIGVEDVLKEIEKSRFELIINDLDFVTKRIEKLERELRLHPKDKAVKEKEMDLLQKLRPVLEKESPLRGMEFDEHESLIMNNYNLATTKPVLYVLNIAQDQDSPATESLILKASEKLRSLEDYSTVAAVKGTLELEVASMESDEIAGFMEEFGIEQMGKDRVIQEAYRILDLITFFTVGDDECRGWTLRRGRTALEAAGAIHTDLARGFIRAEVIDYATLLQVGSLQEAKKTGKLRLEGKTYVVKDGEVVHIMFNV